MTQKKIVVFSGAGVSAESGLRTFRDSDGLWEGYRVEDVATPDAWRRNPEMVLEFYNERRRSVIHAKPNAAHLSIAKLEQRYSVHVITQNVDDLHERAGSSRVLHLHGEIRKSQSTGVMERIYDIPGEALNIGDCCEEGYQLRPFIVWFGEAVPKMDEAIEIARHANTFIVVGTSLAVYPAANLVAFVNKGARGVLIDPKAREISVPSRFEIVAAAATEGVPAFVQELLD